GQHTLTVTVATKGEPAADKTFPILKSAKLFIDDGPGKDKVKPEQEPGLADLPAGAVVFLKLSADRKAGGSVRAEGPRGTGVGEAVDPAQNTLTLTVAVAKGEPAVDKTFSVAPNAGIFISQGKGKEKSPVKANRLADLPAGTVATVRLSLDQRSVVEIVAEG